MRSIRCTRKVATQKKTPAGKLQEAHPLCPALFSVSLAAETNAEAEYTFTLIADSAGPFSNFYSPSPSLNEAGTVAFAANLDNGRLGIFTGNGGIVTTIALAALPNGSFGYPSINQAGTVAFFATEGNGVGERIVSGSGGPLVTIADTARQFRGFYPSVMRANKHNIKLVD